MTIRLSFTMTCLAILALIAAGCGGSAGVPDTPDGTVLAVAEEMANNNPGVLWDAMPSSYQDDVESVIHDAAAKMDAEVYDKGFVILEKLVEVLKDKRDFILSHPMVQSTLMAMSLTNQEELKQNWDEIVEFVAILAASEIRNLDSLQTIDVGAFLDGTGGKLMSQIEKISQISSDTEFAKTWDKFKNVEVDVKSTEGDKAVIEVKTEGEAPWTGTLVKVEGKWIPEDVARDWKKNMDELKAQVAGWSGMMGAEQKTMMMAQMAGIEAVLDQLAKAETQEEFNQAIAGLMGGM